MIALVKGNQSFRSPQGLNRVFEHQVDFSVIQLELAPTSWLAGAAVYEVDGPVFLLEVPWGVFPVVVVISPGRVAPLWARRTTWPVAVVVAGSLGVVVLDDAVGECSAIPGGVVCVLVPRTLTIQELIQVRLVEGGAELGPFGDGDSVLGATLAVLDFGRLGAIVLLPMMRWVIVASLFRVIVPLRGTLGGVVLGLVPAVSSLGIFHVGVLIDDHHHVAHSLGVALKHLPP